MSEATKEEILKDAMNAYIARRAKQTKRIYEVELKQLEHTILLRLIADSDEDALMQTHKARQITANLCEYLIGDVRQLNPLDL